MLVSLKADAYGHGALRVARTTLLNGASWLGVATLSEAIPLRAAGITAPILVFGYIPPWQAREATRLDLRATVYSTDVATELAQAARDLDHTVRVHVKVDTGMARLGLRAEDIEGVVRFIEELRGMRGVEVEGIFTHLATADTADQTYALRQLARFDAVLAALDARRLRPPIIHAANSAATLTLPQSRYSLVRPGIAIYWLAPSEEVPLPAGFQPALAFKTQVAQVKTSHPVRESATARRISLSGRYARRPAGRLRWAWFHRAPPPGVASGTRARGAASSARLHGSVHGGGLARSRRAPRRRGRADRAAGEATLTAEEVARRLEHDLL